MVDGLPFISEKAAEISDILVDFDIIAGYNVSFDIEFLKRAGIKIPRVALVDLMQDFSEYQNEKEEQVYHDQLRCCERCHVIPVKYKDTV